MKIELRRYGTKGWEFTISWHDPVLDEDMSVQYRTNIEGAGLWRWGPFSNVCHPDGSPFRHYKQIKGPNQFSLPEEYKSAYDAIRYRWKKAINDVD